MMASQTATMMAYLPCLLSVLQCALLHPSFAHSRLARMIRTGLTPINFIWSFTLPFRSSTRLPEDAKMTQKMALASMGIYLSIKSLEWGFATGSYYSRTPKTVDGVHRWEKVRELDEPSKKLQENEPCDLFKLAAWTLLHMSSQRGLQFTSGASTDAHTQSLTSLLARVFKVNIPFTIAFAFIAMTRDSPFGTPTSALLSLGVPNFPGLKIISEGFYSICFGISIACSMDILFTISTLAATIAFKFGSWLGFSDTILQLVDPKFYPPIFNSPHKSSSLAEFWGRGWHTLAQRSFLTLGGTPMVWITRKMGASPKIQKIAGLFATFAASGIYHEYGIFAVIHPVQPHHHFFEKFPGTLFFFMVQPLGILIEPYVIPLIPKKIGGGRLWLWTFSVIVAYPFRYRYLSDAQFAKDFKPLSEWSWLYTLVPLKV